MASDVPENAPPDAESLLDWGENHADQVGISSAEEQGLFEVSIAFGDASLVVAGTLGREGTPAIWETASLLVGGDVETNAALQFPQQMNAPPIVRDEDENALTIRTVDAEFSFTPDSGERADDAADDDE